MISFVGEVWSYVVVLSSFEVVVADLWIVKYIFLERTPIVMTLFHVQVNSQ